MTQTNTRPTNPIARPTNPIFRHSSPNLAGASFFAALEDRIASHPALRHPFLQRFAETKLTREQMAAYAAQHYMYSRFFARNLAAVVANLPDEHGRSLLILNLYEEIGEPLKFRHMAHRLLLEAGVVKPEDVSQASLDALSGPNRADVTQILIDRGLVTRAQVAKIVESATLRAGQLTHPALFRRFLRALGVAPERIDEIEPLPETARFIEEYRQVCRDGHWMEAMGAMGPGTECVVPGFYRPIEQGLANSGLLTTDDYIFWTIHIHCDDGHGKNIIDAMAPFATTREAQQRIEAGARRVLDARALWFDGLLRLVF